MDEDEIKRQRPAMYWYYGPSFYTRAARELTIAWWRRKNVIPGEITYRYNLTITWDWPSITWHKIKDEPGP